MSKTYINFQQKFTSETMIIKQITHFGKATVQHYK